MSKLYLFGAISFSVLSIMILLGAGQANNDYGERVKMAMREVGNQLLSSHGDSTSIIHPIVEVADSKFELSFENEFAFEPDELIAHMKSSLRKSDLAADYRVEVIRCIDDEVAYSFEVQENPKGDILPCRGRAMPEACYTIKLRFLNPEPPLVDRNMVLLGLMSMAGLCLLAFFLKRPKNANNYNTKEVLAEKHTSIGSIKFYPSQYKLITPTTEISLSQKECELLTILAAAPNQIVTREELTKQVWEDNGVIVGRSLDTYISKLRKKLKDDENLSITNTHGVGYTLEIVG